MVLRYASSVLTIFSWKVWLDMFGVIELDAWSHVEDQKEHTSWLTTAQSSSEQKEPINLKKSKNCASISSQQQIQICQS